jgi:peptide/nickel transport system ATP-binding protein
VTSANRQAVLSVQELSVSLRSRGQSLTVVDHLNLDLMPGEIVGLVGESGCGKSMTASALMGMLPTTSATMHAKRMTLGDTDLCGLNEKGWRSIRGDKISMIFQEPMTALDPVFSIGNQMTSIIRRHQGGSRSQARHNALRVLSQVGLSDTDRVFRSYAHELSGGMRQRVLIGMAMSCQPRVLIADEPTTALDVTTQKQILQQIHELAKKSGTAVLLITHDLAVVAEVCDRALVMYCGCIVEQAAVEDLFKSPQHPYTAGLLAALPRLSKGTAKPVKPIPGSVPDLANIPSACRFRDRCPRADDLCRQQTPKLSTASASVSHQFRCHHPMELNS